MPARKPAGLYANIHAKQERIRRGSGEHMRAPGSPGAPSDDAFRQAKKTAKTERTEKAGEAGKATRPGRHA